MPPPSRYPPMGSQLRASAKELLRTSVRGRSPDPASCSLAQRRHWDGEDAGMGRDVNLEKMKPSFC